MSLINFLSALSSTETQLKVYVDPDNVNEYVCSRDRGPNGWANLGSLESLSFGNQSSTEAIEVFLEGETELVFNDRVVHFSPKGLVNAYKKEIGNCEFFEWLEDLAEGTKLNLAKSAAEIFVYDTLPEILTQAREDRAYLASEID